MIPGNIIRDPQIHSAYRMLIKPNNQPSDSTRNVQSVAAIAKHRSPPQGAPPIGFSCTYKPPTSSQAGCIMKAPASSVASSLRNTCPPPPPPKSVSFSAIPQSGAPSYPPTAVTSREGSMSPSEAIAMSRRLEVLEQQVRSCLNHTHSAIILSIGNYCRYSPTSRCLIPGIRFLRVWKSSTSLYQYARALPWDLRCMTTRQR
jgi:hypothetical protein